MRSKLVLLLYIIRPYYWYWLTCIVISKLERSPLKDDPSDLSKSFSSCSSYLWQQFNFHALCFVRWCSTTAPVIVMAECWMTPGSWEPTVNLWSWFWARSSNWLCGREWSPPWDQAKCLNLPVTLRLFNWSTEVWLDMTPVLFFCICLFFFHCAAYSTVPTRVPVTQKH